MHQCLDVRVQEVRLGGLEGSLLSNRRESWYEKKLSTFSRDFSGIQRDAAQTSTPFVITLDVASAKSCAPQGEIEIEDEDKDEDEGDA